MSYKEELGKVEKRIDKYWSTEEIDIDLANHIVDDCAKLIGEVHELRATLKASNKSVTEFMLFQNLVEDQLPRDEFYRLLGVWQQKLSEQRVAP